MSKTSSLMKVRCGKTGLDFYVDNAIAIRSEPYLTTGWIRAMCPWCGTDDGGKAVHNVKYKPEEAK